MLQVILLVAVSFLFACVGDECNSKEIGNVKDCGNGNKGYILVNSGEVQGQKDDIGIWVDPITIPSLRGDKGDTGLQGIQGTKGDTGLQGIQGTKGDTGLQGIQGTKGDTGLNGKDGINGVKGEQGIQGNKGDNGLDFDPKEVVRLDNKIDNETSTRIDVDNNLNSIITKETKARKGADNRLQKIINTETKERKVADKIEKKARILGDKKLQNNINKVDINSQNRDIVLQDNINNEANIRGNADNYLNGNINAVNSRVDNINKRVNNLESTQYNAKTELKFIRKKNFEVGVYSTFNSNRKTVSEVGINVVIGVGESYLDKENKITKQRLDNIEEKLGNMPVLEKMVDSNGMIRSIRISGGQIQINKEF
jgi:tetrahydromethanopterin S-methyltransferase subunit G